MTPEYAELCERLKATQHVAKANTIVDGKPINPDGPAAAAAIERLSAENEALRAKLKIWVPTTRTETETALKGADQ